MNGRKWTEEEIKLLHTGMSNKEIAKQIGRTVTAVKDKRNKVRRKIASPEHISKVHKECRILELAKKLGVKIWTRNGK